MPPSPSSRKARARCGSGFSAARAARAKGLAGDFGLFKAGGESAKVILRVGVVVKKPLSGFHRAGAVLRAGEDAVEDLGGDGALLDELAEFGFGGGEVAGADNGGDGADLGFDSAAKLPPGAGVFGRQREAFGGFGGALFGEFNVSGGFGGV